MIQPLLFRTPPPVSGPSPAFRPAPAPDPLPLPLDSADVGGDVFAGSWSPYAPPVVQDPSLGRTVRVDQLREKLQDAPGTLVVVDSFHQVPSLGVPGMFGVVEWAASHGRLVCDTALDSGFRGPVVEVEASDTFSGADRELLGRAAVASWRWKQAADPAEIRAALTEWTAADRASLLRSRREHLDMLREGGLEHSVVNLSSGCNAAAHMGALLDEILPVPGASPMENIGKQHNHEQLVRAMGVDSAVLFGSDAAAARAERTRLFGGLHDLLQAADRDPVLQQERAAYESSVQELVERGNSVVVSAGNQGEIAGKLRRITGNSDFDLPASSLHNELSTPLTVTVGATVRFDLGETVASYSNFSPEVRLHADGVAYGSGGKDGPDRVGTSFATPRVAAVLADLHRHFPALSQRELVEIAEQKLSSRASMNGIPLSILDADRTAGFLLSGQL